MVLQLSPHFPILLSHCTGTLYSLDDSHVEVPDEILYDVVPNRVAPHPASRCDESGIMRSPSDDSVKDGETPCPMAIIDVEDLVGT